MLVKATKPDGSHKYVVLSNKMDTVANGKHLTGYSQIKQRQLSKHNDIVTLDYAEMIDAYKQAADVEAF